MFKPMMLFGKGGVPAAPPSSTQWRVQATAVQGAGSWFSLSEIEMRATIGGANQCSGGTASASGTSGSNVAANAFDGNNATIWQSGTATMPQWIQYTFPSAVTVAELVLLSTTAATDAPTNFVLQYFDGASWQTAMTVTGKLWNASQACTFPVGSAKSISDNWRINVTSLQDSSGSRRTEIGEIEMRTVASGADQCNSGSAFASGSFFTNGQNNAFANDGVTSTWLASGTSLPQWIGYAFTADLNILEVALTCNAVTSTASPPTAFDVQYFNGSAWVTMWSATTPATWTTGGTRVFTKP